MSKESSKPPRGIENISTKGTSEFNKPKTKKGGDIVDVERDDAVDAKSTHW